MTNTNQLDLATMLDENYNPYEEDTPSNPQRELTNEFLLREQSLQLQALRGTEGKGFINDYINCYSPTTEAPDVIFAAGAAQLISVAVGRKIWLSQGAGSIGLQNYIQALGPSGSNKSSAMDRFRDHAERIEGVITLGAGLSRASFEKAVEAAEGDPIVLMVDEYATLQATFEASYGQGLEALITEAYGGKVPLRTLSGDVQSMRERPNRVASYVCMYSCSTPEWFNKGVSDIRTGAIPRQLTLWHAESTKVIYEQPEPNHLAILKLDEELYRIREAAHKAYDEGKAKAVLSPQAVADVGIPWYTSWKQRLVVHRRRDLLTPLWKRLDWIGRKMAVIMFIAENPGAELVIPSEYLRRGYRLADSVLSVYEHKLNEGWLANPDQQAIHAILAHLREHLLDTEVGLSEAAEMSLQQTRIIITAMVASGMIKEQKAGSVVKYKLY